MLEPYDAAAWRKLNFWLLVFEDGAVEAGDWAGLLVEVDAAAAPVHRVALWPEEISKTREQEDQKSNWRENCERVEEDADEPYGEPDERQLRGRLERRSGPSLG